MSALENATLNAKTVLVRLDLNVPVVAGVISDDNRIRQALPTLNLLRDKGAKVVVFSHFGRVKTEEDKAKKSLRIVSEALASHLGVPVTFVPHTRGEVLEKAIQALQPGEVLMFENTRFEDVEGKKESKNDSELGRYWASLGDVFVNDAFGTAHRAHASNVGIASNIAEVYPGYLMEKEMAVFEGLLTQPKRPFIAVLGGAKVSDKIGVIQNLLAIADKVIIGGGMSYTFLKAQGYEIGTSLVEDDKLDLAKELLDKGQDKLVFAKDFKLTKEFSNDTPIRIGAYDDFKADEMGLDIGPATLEMFSDLLKTAQTVVWNGPVGVFEMSNFAQGTEGICEVLAALDGATTIIGGGDSAAAAIQMGFEYSFTHISTGGGASLEYLEGKKLPGIEALKR